mmetsp:Transcript_3832/g.7081  ORF Transcript_3832/g.7081 Transcript_3832/m.7081 type:complete len:523 (+) Transcript_3832:52-1620(+)
MPSEPRFSKETDFGMINEEEEIETMSSNSKIKRRLARKAELARASRRRKKAYVQDLELKVAQLNAKVMELQQDQLGSDQSAVALALSAMTELDPPKAHLKKKVKIEPIGGNDNSMEVPELSAGPSNESSNPPTDEDTVLALSQAVNDRQQEPQKFCFKANCEGDIRRFSLQASGFTFEGLKEMLVIIYQLQPDSFTISYFDEDEDAVSITSTAELREAHRLASRFMPRRGHTSRASAEANANMADSVLKIFVSVMDSKENYGSPGMRRRRAGSGASEESSSTNAITKHRALHSDSKDVTFVQMQEVKLGLRCTVSRLWLPAHPDDTLGRLLEQFRLTTKPTPGRGSPASGAEMLSVSGQGPAVQRLSYKAKLLDLKSTVAECGIDDKSTVHVVQVENAEMVPRGSRDSFRVYVNCEENGFWIEAQVSPSVRVHLLLQSVMAHVGFLGSALKGSSVQRPVWLLYRGVRIPKHQDETLGVYDMKDGDRVDVVDNSGSGLGIRHNRVSGLMVNKTAHGVSVKTQG